MITSHVDCTTREVIFLIALNSKLLTKNGVFTKSQSASTSHIFVRQFGNVVSVNGWIEGLTLNANADTKIGTISGVSLPPDIIRTRGNAGANAYSVGNNAYITIQSSNGEIHVTASGGTAVYFNATYVAN